MLLKKNTTAFTTFLESQQEQEIAMRDDLNIWDRYNMGFKRPERLDVKKPGPPFDPSITEATKKGTSLISFKFFVLLKM